MNQASQVLDLELPEAEQAVLQVKDLQKELLVLRLAFGQLKAAVANASAPLAAVFVPALTSAIRDATRLVKTLGQVMAGLLGVQVAQTKVEKKVVSAGKAAKRSVAGFDQLNRLQGASGGQSVSTRTVPVEVKATLSPEVQAIVTKIQEIFAPLQSIDLFPLQWAFARLQEHAGKFAEVAGQVLGTFWRQVLVPILGWVVESMMPTLLNLGTSVFRFLGVCLEDVAEGFFYMLEKMRPVAEFAGTVVTTVFDLLREVMAKVRISAETNGTALNRLFHAVGDAVSTLWQRIHPVLEVLRQVFVQTFQSVGVTVFEIMGHILKAVSGVIIAVSGLLTGDWTKVWQGLTQVCKSAVNSIIGVLNVLLAGLAGALNGVFKLLNKISVEVPDWVPGGLGGKTFGFKLKELSAPRIPYLAKGAVLPANQPFLAMVGDQKHGTNVEAPLATIQEAVAVVLDEQLSALMSGFNATVQELQMLRKTVGNIRVGDDVIYRAAERYRDKRAVMHGTGW